MRIVILGLSVTSSWGNGHATTYRGLLRGLTHLGHDVLFLERNQPWYAEHRDLPDPPYGRTELYDSTAELQHRFAAEVSDADLVVVGSYVPDGVEVGRWATGAARGVTAFYDIDTPVTLAALARGDCAYLDVDLVPAYDLYLSFTGGPTLDLLERRYGAARACAFHCSVDPEEHRPRHLPPAWDLGYLGTYSDDRQPVLERLLLTPARRRPDLRFVVAGPQYPSSISWPDNVERIEHLAPHDHADFYARQRLTLNITRADMVRAGWSPSVRLFEAAACGVPVLSDRWPGLEEFFHPGTEILLADSAEDVLAVLADMTTERRRVMGAAARARILAGHTAAHRAARLERLAREALAARAASVGRRSRSSAHG
jgi:spore maturation protein CgeB